MWPCTTYEKWFWPVNALGSLFSRLAYFGQMIYILWSIVIVLALVQFQFKKIVEVLSASSMHTLQECDAFQNNLCSLRKCSQRQFFSEENKRDWILCSLNCFKSSPWWNCSRLLCKQGRQDCAFLLVTQEAFRFQVIPKHANTRARL